ncbi:hypothetical protein BDAP_001999 [Binucleata daphniae]
MKRIFAFAILLSLLLLCIIIYIALRKDEKRNELVFQIHENNILLQEYKDMLANIKKFEEKTSYSNGKCSVIAILKTYVDSILLCLEQHSFGSKLVKNISKENTATHNTAITTAHTPIGISNISKCINEMKKELEGAIVHTFDEMHTKDMTESNMFVKMLIEPTINVLKDCKVDMYGKLVNEIVENIMKKNDDNTDTNKYNDNNSSNNSKNNGNNNGNNNIINTSHFEEIHSIIIKTHESMQDFYYLLDTYNLYLIYSSLVNNGKKGDKRELEQCVISSFYKLAMILTKNVKIALFYVKERKNRITNESVYDSLLSLCNKYENVLNKISKKNMVKPEIFANFYVVFVLNCMIGYHIIDEYTKKSGSAGEKGYFEKNIKNTNGSTSESKELVNNQDFMKMFDTLTKILLSVLQYVNKAINGNKDESIKIAAEFNKMFNDNYEMFKKVENEYFYFVKIVDVMNKKKVDTKK